MTTYACEYLVAPSTQHDEISFRRKWRARQCWCPQATPITSQDVRPRGSDTRLQGSSMRPRGSGHLESLPPLVTHVLLVFKLLHFVDVLLTRSSLSHPHPSPTYSLSLSQPHRSHPRPHQESPLTITPSPDTLTPPPRVVSPSHPHRSHSHPHPESSHHHTLTGHTHTLGPHFCLHLIDGAVDDSQPIVALTRLAPIIPE